MILEFLRLLVIELLFGDRREGGDALPIGEATDPATALLCRPQFVRIEFRKSFQDFLPKRIDCFFISRIGHFLPQVEVGLVLAFPKGKCRTK